MSVILTLIIGVISGFFLNLLVMKINFKQRTIENKIKVYDAIITIWVRIRNQIFHGAGANRWSDLDNIYGQSQTYIGEAFLVCDNQELVIDINQLNEDFYRQNWHELEDIGVINVRIEELRNRALRLIPRMRDDIHASSRITLSDLSHMFKGFLN